jgi:Fibronectin type III domain
MPRRQRGQENVMTYPEITGQDLQATSAPAAPQAQASAHDPPTEQDPASAQPPATVASRRWRRGAVSTLAALVVAGLTAALVVWAPWIPPPVLRPAGLQAGPSTANSITLRWSNPPTGPLPDKYLILSNGTMAGSVAGTVTAYRQARLDPATAYQYRVVAVRGGKRSPQSAALAVRTITPPLSQARLQGPWDVYAKKIRGGPESRNGTLFWEVNPACAAGACNLIVDVKEGRHTYQMTLTRVGPVYQGHAALDFIRCGTASNSIPDPATLKFRVRVTAAAGESQVWTATSLAGTLVGTFRYVSSAAFYCPPSTFKASLAGTPA